MLFRIMHPWIWLNEPQHGTAVAAVTSVVSTVAAIFAGIFAFKAFQQAKEQVVQARLQVEQAKRQADQAVVQTSIARSEAANNERRLDAQHVAAIKERREIYDKRIAEEDASRPRFSYGGAATYGDRMETEIRNVGLTPASNVVVLAENGDKEIVVAKGAALQPGSMLPVVLSNQHFETVGYIIRFTSITGSQWTVRLYGGANVPCREEVVSTIRPYSP